MSTLLAVWHGTRDGTAGADPTGVRALVAAVADDTAAGVDGALAALDETLAAVPRPLSAATGDPTELEAAVAAAVAVEQRAGTEVVSALGVTRFFSDNDGDS